MNKALKYNRILVLGGAGFLGSHLSRALLAGGYQVRILGNASRDSAILLTEAHKNCEYIVGDFLQEDDLKVALSNVDVVYHLISTTLPSTSNLDPIFDVETNVIGTLRLLNLIRETEVKKTIFVSSGGTVYGDSSNTVPASESDLPNPLCSYGITKLTIEKYLHLYFVLYGMNYCVLRLANLFGEGHRLDTGQGAVDIFLHKAMKNEEIEVWGDGSVVRDYIYVEDAVDALLKARDYDGTEKVFNIGSGEGRSLNDLLSDIEGLLGRPVKRSYAAKRNFDVSKNVMDISLADAVLSWRPHTPFTEGLARTMKWLLR